MYKNVLVPVALDHEGHGPEALAMAKTLAGDSGKVTVMHVLERVPSFITQQLPEGTSERQRDEAMEGLQALAAGGGGAVTCKVVWGHAARTILDEADDMKADCIVIASHQPGLEDYFIGSTASHVVRHAHCSVHVMR